MNDLLSVADSAGVEVTRLFSAGRIGKRRISIQGEKKRRGTVARVTAMSSPLSEKGCAAAELMEGYKAQRPLHGEASWQMAESRVQTNSRRRERLIQSMAQSRERLASTKSVSSSAKGSHGTHKEVGLEVAFQVALSWS